MELLCGTSGFSFKEWKGPFYPPKLPADEMLGFYSARLPTVEINNTFYRMPKPSLLEAWAARVPETFRFSVKAPRRISHTKQLKDCGEEAGFFFGAVAALGQRFAAVLVQLPPHARVGVEKLAAFLKLVPATARVAFEFRHPSWNNATVLKVLEDHGAAWVTADNDGTVPSEIHKTASWTYLRMRAPDYTDESLRDWRARCAKFERAFVYFKHEDGAAGPKFAERMQRI